MTALRVGYVIDIQLLYTTDKVTGKAFVLMYDDAIGLFIIISKTKYNVFFDNFA